MTHSFNRVLKADDTEGIRNYIPLDLSEQTEPDVKPTALPTFGEGEDTVHAGRHAADAGQQEMTDQNVLEAARKEAERILAEARADAEKMRQDASNRGYEEGLERGRQEGIEIVRKESNEEHQKFLEECQQTIEGYSAIKKRLLDRYLNELTQFALTVVEKVIHVSLQSSSKVIARMITIEAEKHRKTSWVKIYLDRKDYESMIEVESDLAAELSNLSDNIKFVVLDDEPEGSVILETPEEIIDMGVDTQLGNIRNRLKEVHVESREEDVRDTDRAGS